ncbi:T9SS type A sorting domain-containing protein [Fidelibacter multiformis]|uniref:T9SS type A sorting domain-containing protein n=1 Tax=Fidelibacter multiformis TaxID=3377529 RepID=UPI0037DC9E59
MKKLWVWQVMLSMFCATFLLAQTSGDYRSKTSGNWTSTATWETYSGSEWQDAETAPNSGSGVVTVLNGHTVTINSTLTIDQIVVDAGGTLTVDLSSSESLTINNGDGDDLTVNGTLNMSGVLQNEGLGLTGTGKTVINGTCNWNSGHITSTNFNIASGGVMDMEGSGECRINEDGVVNNAGTVNFAKSGVAFVMYYNGTFNNLNGGIFEATTNQSIYHRNDLSWGNMPEFNNAGTFRKKTGTGTTTVYKMEFNNTGTVDIQTGTLKFTAYARGTHTGTFTIASGATILTEEYSDHDFNEGSVINGAGTFEITSDQISVNGTTNGTVIGSDVTFKLSQIDNSKKSVMTGAGKLTINGTFDWTTTGNFNTGTIIVGENGNLNISGDNQKTYYYSSGANLLENYGTITWSGAGGISGGDKTIRNKSTGLIDIQNNATFLANSGIYTVINDGLIKKSAGSGTTTFAVHLTNNGTLTVETGVFYLSSSSGFTNYINDNDNGDRLEGGTYNLKGKLKYKPPNSDDTIIQNKATIILDGASSEILLTNSDIERNALISLGSISSDGSLTLRNGRNFSTDAGTFTNSGTLDCGTNIFSGGGNFTNADNAWLIIASTDGITSSGSNGNIQSSGTRTFHTGGKYHYNGTSAQVTGIGLPATVRHLMIENSSGVTLSSNVTASTDLILSEGALITGSNTLTLGSSAGSVGTLTRTNGKIIGNFKRWLAASTVDDVLFPIGTADHYRPVSLSYTSAPSTGGTLTASFTASNPGSSGLPLSDGEYAVNTVAPDGYWSLTSADDLSGGTYDLDITAENFGGIADYSLLRILKRADSESVWMLDGSHTTGTGSNAIPVLHRSGLNGFSEFGVGSNSNDNSLPVTLSAFTAQAVKGAVVLEWETSAEIENQGFILSRKLKVESQKSEIIAGFATDDALKGQGSTTETTKYLYVDKTVEHGKTYVYSLTDVDYSGNESILKKVEVQVKTEETIVAEGYVLDPVYPNPFNAILTVPFTLTEPMHVSIDLYSLTGRHVLTAVKREFTTGSYLYTIKTPDLSSGIYLIRTSFGGEIHLQKAILLK